MNRIKNIFMPAFCAAAASAFSFAGLTSCSDWTAPESVGIHVPTVEEEAPEQYGQYLRQLNEYKQGEHKVVMAFISNVKGEAPESQSMRLEAYPDSIDVLCLAEAENLHSDYVSAIGEVQRKGTAVYYEIDFNVLDLTYSMRTYSVDEASDPMGHYTYGAKCFDRWEDGGSDLIEFYIGWGGSPQDAGNHQFVQDANNPHLFYYPENGTWTLEAGEEMNFIISNVHPDGWWDHVEWRCDDSANPEKFGYFSKKNDVNPNWEGTNQKWEDGSPVGDNWMKPVVVTGGNYRFEFDSHLGRGKIVPAN